jgi:hypothetical protein
MSQTHLFGKMEFGTLGFRTLEFILSFSSLLLQSPLLVGQHNIRKTHKPDAAI